MSTYSSMTVRGLKEECEGRGLAVSGTKAALIARLEEADEEPPAKAAHPPVKKGKGSQVDQYYHGSGSSVYEDADDIWDVLLMQVSIERNNDKYYVLQLIECSSSQYDVFTRWGRVSEPGQNNIVYSGGLEGAKKAFDRKFKDKTKNVWAPGIRDTFKVHGAAEKTYTLMDMADESEVAEAPIEEEKGTRVKKAAAKVRACTLEAPLQSLLSLCFNEDTITDQLKALEIDTKKMPVGQISRAQLEKGRAVLEKLAKVVAGETKGDVNDLTGQFYTYVPHSFGRNRPPPLKSTEALQNKFDLINTLTDMSMVQDMMAKDKESDTEATEVDHPLDRQYRELSCDIKVVPKSSSEYDYVSKYFEATKQSGLKLLDVFTVDRAGEGKRYAAHDSLDNRKLLWHGTNIAVVVAILKTGLRIMPHSGGRVGRGIYHASENSKSAGYVRTAKKTGVMFIDEVALGKMKEINADDWTITKPPAGFDSVLAQGWTEPAPKDDLEVEIEGRKVTVPQGKVTNRPEWKGSRFSQSEYLVYQESQVRMRYMLRIEFPY